MAAPDERLRAAVRRWYRAHGRHELPWRQTRDPYAVLVSEVMLQQTQVGRVVPYWEAWLERWPAAAALASTPLAEVIRAWSGLGYNRRALNLRRAAVATVERHDGKVPTDPSLLRQLPGIGLYTASAVACFAGGRRATVVDTNVARVLARLQLGYERMAAGTPAAAEAARRLLPPRDARDWNLALMDLGATVCTARKPDCDRCPVSRMCAWYAAGRPPLAERLTPTTPRFETTARFARGRLIAALRAGPATIADLAGAVGPSHAIDVHGYLAALAREGLVEPAGSGSWRLPGDGQPLREG